MRGAQEEDFFGPEEKGLVWPWLTIILAITVLVIGAFSIWQYRESNKKILPIILGGPLPSSAPTLNWKTYANQKQGYVINYPDNWEVVDDAKDADGNQVVDFYRSKLRPENQNKPQMEIRVNKYPEKISPIAKSLMAERSQPVKIANLKGTRIDENLSEINYGLLTNSDLLLITNGNLYWFQLNFYKDNNAADNMQEKAILDSMVSSFRFLPTGDQADSDKNDWKTYRNDKFGFTVGYPADWKVEDINQKGVNASYLDESQSCSLVAGFSYVPNDNIFALDNGMDMQIVYCPDQSKYPDISLLLDKIGNGQIIQTAGFEGVLEQFDLSVSNVPWDSAMMYKKFGTGFFQFSWNGQDEENQNWNYQNYGIRIIESFQYTKM